MKHLRHHNLNDSSEYIRYNERNLKEIFHTIKTLVERSNCKTVFRKDLKKGNVVNRFYELKIIQKTFSLVY